MKYFMFGIIIKTTSIWATLTLVIKTILLL